MKKIFSVFVLLLFCGLATHPSAETQSSKHPRNVILMIGDGMGVSALTAGKIAGGKLALEDFPVAGFAATWAEDDLVTDSAAAATALACGRKTKNGRLALARDGKPLPTLVEEARLAGLKTGVVATCAVTHATPAAFLSHVDGREKYFDIAAQEAASGVDLLMGGGRAHFLPKGAGGEREDGKNLIEAMERAGRCAFLQDSLPVFPLEKPCAKILLLMADGHMPPAPERRPSSAAMTRFALDFLSQEKRGFFLMVEGSQIDWGGHAGDAAYLTAEMLDFDDAVAEVLSFARRRRDTLAVVTADHETGGFAVTGGSLAERKVEGKFVWDEHTAQMAPVFAFGPGAVRFGGIHDNAEIGEMLLRIVRDRRPVAPETLSWETRSPFGRRRSSPSRPPDGGSGRKP